MFNERLKSKINILEIQIEHLEEQIELSETHAFKAREEVAELQIKVADYEQVFKDCFETNHRLKKLEEYLGIEYVVEPPSNLFIGYKKKESE